MNSKEKAIKAYNSIISSNFFGAAIIVLVYLIWFFSIEKIGFGILLGLVGLLLATSKDSSNALVIFLAFCYCLRTVNTIEGNLWMAGYILFVVAGVIIHFIRFKPTLKTGRLFPYVIGFCLMIFLGGIYYRGISGGAFWALLGLAVLIVLLYLFFNSTISLKGDAFAEFLCRYLVLLGILMCLQVITYYAQVEDVVEAMQNKQIKVGWGISNNIGAILCLTIPATWYYATKRGWRTFVAPALAVLQSIILVLTFSRGSILAVACGYPFVLGYTLYKAEDRKGLLLQLVVYLFVFGIVLAFTYDKIYFILKNMLDKGFDDSGRFPLYREAVEVFKQHPIFGIGFDYKMKDTGEPYWFHNTYFEALGKLGILGFLALCLLNLKRYIISIKAMKFTVVSFLIASIICFEFYGLLDTNFFHPIQFAFLLMLNIAFERILDQDEFENIPVPVIKPIWEFETN